MLAERQHTWQALFGRIFSRVYTNKYFTYLYEDKNVILKHDINFLAMENMYLEKMIPGMLDRQIIHTDILIISTDCCNLYTKMRLFQNIVYLRRGGCYIISREQVLKNSREFYMNLNKIMSYGLEPNFPSEAHQIERMMPVFFSKLQGQSLDEQ